MTRWMQHPQLLVSFLAAASLLLLCLPAAALAEAGRTPVPPLLAWDVAADGAVYVLDTQQRVYELDPATLAPVKASPRLAPIQTDGGAQLAADADRVYVRGDQLDGIQVLDRQSLDMATELPIDAAALAVEGGKRLFFVERTSLPQMPGLSSFAVKSLPLDDLQASPQSFGITASQPYASLYDLAVDTAQGLLYVGTLDTSGSPNRHFRTWRAYDLDSGDEVELDIERQPASTAERPVFAEGAPAAIAYRWEGFYPQQSRIYLVTPGQDSQAIEGLSGPLALAPGGEWIYLVRDRGLWVLRAGHSGSYSVQSVIPFLPGPPSGVRLSPDAQTLYLLGNGWLAALPTGELQAAGTEAFAPFPQAWLSQAADDPQAARLFAAADGGDVALVNLAPAGEWYRSSDRGANWQLLPDLQYPPDQQLDRISLSPTLAEDGTIVGRGAWQDGERTLWRSQDAGTQWIRWLAPMAFVAGSEGARSLYVVDEPGAQPRAVPVGGSTENPSWSPGWTHLAYQNNGAGDWEIYSVPADCRSELQGPSTAAQPCDVRRLTDSAGEDVLPAWSPDGKYIAFVSLRDGNPEIYVMFSDGSMPTRLTFAPGGDWRPAWLPDSRHLVFTSDRSGSNDILLMELPYALGSTAAEPPVTPVIASPADERDPAVSGDGELLYLSDQDGTMQPYAADLAQFLAGSNPSPLTGSPVLREVEEPIGHPAWLPDGNLLFAAGGRIYTAARYAGRDEWNAVAAPPQPVLHPAGGAAWYWPEPQTGLLNLRP